MNQHFTTYPVVCQSNTRVNIPINHNFSPYWGLPQYPGTLSLPNTSTPNINNNMYRVPYSYEYNTSLIKLAEISSNIRELEQNLDKNCPEHKVILKNDIKIYILNGGIIFICTTNITNPNFLQSILDMCLIKDYHIHFDGFVAILPIQPCPSYSLNDSIILNLAEQLMQSTYLLKIRKEDFILLSNNSIIFIGFDSLLPKLKIGKCIIPLKSLIGEIVHQSAYTLFKNEERKFITRFSNNFYTIDEIENIGFFKTCFENLKKEV